MYLYICTEMYVKLIYCFHTHSLSGQQLISSVLCHFWCSSLSLSWSSYFPWLSSCFPVCYPVPSRRKTKRLLYIQQEIILLLIQCHFLYVSVLQYPSTWCRGIKGNGLTSHMVHITFIVFGIILPILW